MELSVIKEVVRDAVELMILEQWELYEYDVGERTVTSQLFRYMSDDRAVPSHLRVDHRPGDDLENWLVLEAKRGNLCDEIDRMKVVIKGPLCVLDG